MVNEKQFIVLNAINTFEVMNKQKQNCETNEDYVRQFNIPFLYLLVFVCVSLFNIGLHIGITRHISAVQEM